MMDHKILTQECFHGQDDKNGTYNIFSIRTNNETKQPESLNLFEESPGTPKMISLYESIKNALKYRATLLNNEMDAKLHPLLTEYIVNIFFNY